MSIILTAPLVETGLGGDMVMNTANVVNTTPVVVSELVNNPPNVAADMNTANVVNTTPVVSELVNNPPNVAADMNTANVVNT